VNFLILKREKECQLYDGEERRESFAFEGWGGGSGTPNERIFGLRRGKELSQKRPEGKS